MIESSFSVIGKQEIARARALETRYNSKRGVGIEALPAIKAEARQSALEQTQQAPARSVTATSVALAVVDTVLDTGAFVTDIALAPLNVSRVVCSSVSKDSNVVLGVLAALGSEVAAVTPGSIGLFGWRETPGMAAFFVLGSLYVVNCCIFSMCGPKKVFPLTTWRIQRRKQKLEQAEKGEESKPVVSPVVLRYWGEPDRSQSLMGRTGSWVRATQRHRQLSLAQA